MNMKYNKSYYDKGVLRKMKSFKITKHFILLSFVIIVIITASSVSAKENVAEKAYLDYLKGDYVYWYPYGNVPNSDLKYDIKDINNDGIQELMIQDTNVANEWGFYRLYTYHNSEIELVWMADNGSGSGEFYPDLQIYVTERLHQGVYEKTYYSYKQLPMEPIYTATSVEKINEDSRNDFSIVKEYQKNREPISEEQYKYEIRNLLKGEEGKSFEFKKLIP